MREHKTYIFAVVVVLVSGGILVPVVLSANDTTDQSLVNERVIRIAMYDYHSYSLRDIIDMWDYSWTIDNHTYRFEMTFIYAEDVLGTGNHTLSIDSFDLFVIGASASSYLVEGVNPLWKSTVQQFVADGGGFIGICGGANAASMGFENPTNVFQRRVNRGVLELADVYINDNLLGEWQYMLKYGFDAHRWDNLTYFPSYASINTTVIHQPDDMIFNQYENNYRQISYAGGPGMYEAESSDAILGPIIPLLQYNEELMETKPLHYWIPLPRGWQPMTIVKTDLKGTYAGIATTYNSTGRVILFGPHPEESVAVNGSIIEYLGSNMVNSVFQFKSYSFNYFGQSMPREYNWWIARRSAAWVSHVADEYLPPTL